MPAASTANTVIQCDFDGTITYDDVGLGILDVFADGDWKRLFSQYQQGKITVGHFNSQAFAMVREDRSTLIKLVREGARIRDGLHELVGYCRRQGFRFVVVSNGLDFYIKEILGNIGLPDIEVFAAHTSFTPVGIDAKYIGPEGGLLLDGFKESYARLFLKSDCRLIYIGNGPSDIPAARLADHIFATGTLLKHCTRMKLDCTPFAELGDIVEGLKLVSPA